MAKRLSGKSLERAAKWAARKKKKVASEDGPKKMTDEQVFAAGARLSREGKLNDEGYETA